MKIVSVSANSAGLLSLRERWQHKSRYLDDRVANTGENEVVISSHIDLRATRWAFDSESLGFNLLNY